MCVYLWVAQIKNQLIPYKGFLIIVSMVNRSKLIPVFWKVSSHPLCHALP